MGLGSRFVPLVLAVFVDACLWVEQEASSLPALTDVALITANPLHIAFRILQVNCSLKDKLLRRRWLICLLALVELSRCFFAIRLDIELVFQDPIM